MTGPVCLAVTESWRVSQHLQWFVLCGFLKLLSLKFVVLIHSVKNATVCRWHAFSGHHFLVPDQHLLHFWSHKSLKEMSGPVFRLGSTSRVEATSLTCLVLVLVPRVKGFWQLPLPRTWLLLYIWSLVELPRFFSLSGVARRWCSDRNRLKADRSFRIT